MPGELGESWYVLLLSDMRSSARIVRPIARARSAAELQRLLDRERVTLYHEGRFAKSFRRGGMLEWYLEPEQDVRLARTTGIAEVYAVAVRAGVELVTVPFLLAIPSLDDLGARGAGAAVH
jgi:hypothetical protein